MDDLVAFLRARLDEQHAGADDVHGKDCDVNVDTWPVKCDCGEPEWQRADVEAKRRLIAGHGPGRVVDESNGRWASDPDSWDPPWTKCTGHEWEAYPCELLRLLALPYAAHPDYRQEWKP